MTVKSDAEHLLCRHCGSLAYYVPFYDYNVCMGGHRLGVFEVVLPEPYQTRARAQQWTVSFETDDDRLVPLPLPSQGVIDGQEEFRESSSTVG